MKQGPTLNLDAMCSDPGPEGAFWRLVRAWNPENMDAWMAHERARGTSLDTMTKAVASMAALVAWSFGQTTGSTDIVREFLSKLHQYETKRRMPGLIIPGNG